MPAPRHLLDLDDKSLGDCLAGLGQKPFRARQVLEWVYQHGAASFEEMTNLSKVLRETLAAEFTLYASTILHRSASRDGTVKLLLRWLDGATSECVLIPDERRQTACVSSQVGCPVGCRFCASGLNGLQRNLTVGEIVEQVLRIRAEAAHDEEPRTSVRAAPEPEEACPREETPLDRRLAEQAASEAPLTRLSNVVFMGLGEPLANYDAVLQAVRTINAPWGVNIGARKITISTVGLPKQIRRLADEGLQLNLALSLHAPTDALREQLIPWAGRIPLSELTAACRHYFEKTGREITLEYLLLRGVNDRRSHAQQLASFSKLVRCNVNLIRYNAVVGLPYERPTGEEARAFQQHLRDHGVNAHVRTSRGTDIEAACGQLRRRELGETQSA
jgi:23S rRNA (adenine2503-C2)-methyltransferase